MNNNFVFKILQRFDSIPKDAKDQAFLTRDDWNDYDYYTLFHLNYMDEHSTKHEIGSVKIGFVGQEILDRVLNKVDTIIAVPMNHFSLGQDDSYYENLKNCGDMVRGKILDSLNDIAKNDGYYQLAIEEEVTKRSLLRDISITTVTGQFRRIANGGVRLTDYNFGFITANSKMRLTFKVKVDSIPSSNIHVLIATNGVGKTSLINNMIDSLYEGNETANKYGRFVDNYDELLEKIEFPNIINVSFSTFDNTIPKPEIISEKTGIQYAYIGVKKKSEKTNQYSDSKNTNDLTQDFIESLSTCIRNSKIEKWKEVIKKLETDINFKEANIRSLLFIVNDYLFKKSGARLFNTLSSGHKIILLTVTRLIETIQEKSLIFMDEPEAHLHPPLLSAFIRAISELAEKNNGVIIIATHSPIILQEVPKNCVWKLRRSGNESVAERLSIQSFGENVGILTSEVFGLEVTHSGFYTLLQDIVNSTSSYEEALEIFKGRLGMEARSILMSLFYNKNKSNDTL